MLERRSFLRLAIGLTLAAATAPTLAAETAPMSPSTPRALRLLAAMARLLYPHDGLPDANYEAVAGALLSRAGQDPALAATLDSGSVALDAAAGGDWLALPPPERLALLAAHEATPFFQAVRSHTMLALYADPAIWTRFGYGGDAWARGGYVNDVGDLDWLPEPELPR
jgi:hypothetical protein